jgi:hypothetical protein
MTDLPKKARARRQCGAAGPVRDGTDTARGFPRLSPELAEVFRIAFLAT